MPGTVSVALTIWNIPVVALYVTFNPPATATGVVTFVPRGKLTPPIVTTSALPSSTLAGSTTMVINAKSSSPNAVVSAKPPSATLTGASPPTN